LVTNLIGQLAFAGASSMNTSLFTLLFALPIVGTPAPKHQSALTPDLIDLLPEDTSAILLIDVPRVAKSPIGRRFAKYLIEDIGDSSFVTAKDVIDDVELAVVGQFDIVQFAGDFCVILRLRPGAPLLEKLLASVRGREESFKRKIGKHTIHEMDKLYFSIVDSRTVVFASFTNGPSGEELETGLKNVFAQRPIPGPRPELRNRLSEIPFDHAVAVVSDHPKSGTSLKLALVPLGFDLMANAGDVAEYQKNVASYRGGLTVGHSADATVEIMGKNAEAAKGIEKTLQAAIGNSANNDWAERLHRSATVTRSKDKVTLRLSADRAVIDRVFGRE
jgi:hypothetical protein